MRVFSAKALLDEAKNTQVEREIVVASYFLQQGQWAYELDGMQVPALENLGFAISPTWVVDSECFTPAEPEVLTEEQCRFVEQSLQLNALKNEAKRRVKKEARSSNLN